MSTKRVQRGKADSEAASTSEEIHASIPIEAPQEHDIACLGPIPADEEEVRIISHPGDLWQVCKFLVKQHSDRRFEEANARRRKGHVGLRDGDAQNDKSVLSPDGSKPGRDVSRVRSRLSPGKGDALLHRMPDAGIEHRIRRRAERLSREGAKRVYLRARDDDAVQSSIGDDLSHAKSGFVVEHFRWKTPGKKGTTQDV